MAPASKTTLITGATSGIGLALAKIFAKHSYNLLITARKQEELEKTAAELRGEFAVEVQILANDLSKQEAPHQIFDFCKEHNIAIEILANNAGVATYGKFAETALEELLATADINVRALTELTRLFLPQMLERNSGKILNTCSTAAYQPGPLWAVYAASKAYILSFSLAIRNELKGTGISVTAVCPGAVRTGFQKNTKGFSQTRLIRSGVKGRFMLSPDQVAKAAYDALMKNKSSTVVGGVNKLLVFLSKISPVSWSTAVARWTLET